jgi:hypothetical protein
MGLTRIARRAGRKHARRARNPNPTIAATIVLGSALGSPVGRRLWQASVLLLLLLTASLQGNSGDTPKSAVAVNWLCRECDLKTERSIT